MELRTTFAINGDTNKDLNFEESLAANFIQIKRRVKNKEKLIRFTEIFWPFIFIQGNPSYHIMIDEVGLSDFNLKINNAPRTAQVGHVLRDQNFGIIEKMEMAKEIIEFKKTINIDQLDKSQKLDDELISRKINGLVLPELLEGFSKIIRKPENFKPTKFSILDSLYNFDDSINFAQDWMKTLNEVTGNKMRWKTLKSNISEPFDTWITEFVVKEKDAKAIYKGELNRADDIDENFISNKMNIEKDNVDQWVLMEQKDIIRKVGKMFVGIDLIYEDLRKRNNYFLQIDSLKTKMVGEVVMQGFQHISYIRDSIEKSEQYLLDISNKMNTIRKNIENLNISAESKITNKSQELTDQKSIQEEQIRQISRKHEEKIKEIQNYKNKITDLYNAINQIIENKLKLCDEDEKMIRKWEIFDDESNIHNPTIRFFVPVGIGIIEDEDEDERIEFIFPSIYSGKTLTRTPLSSEFLKFEQKITQILDKDMKLRSNFEYTIENSKNYDDLIQKGLTKLKKSGLIE